MKNETKFFVIHRASEEYLLNNILFPTPKKKNNIYWLVEQSTLENDIVFSLRSLEYGFFRRPTVLFLNLREHRCLPGQIQDSSSNNRFFQAAENTSDNREELSGKSRFSLD